MAFGGKEDYTIMVLLSVFLQIYTPKTNCYYNTYSYFTTVFTGTIANMALQVLLLDLSTCLDLSPNRVMKRINRYVANFF
jgi:hypothetical protein